MNTKLYVGNLPYDLSESDIQDMFAAHGNVVSVDVIMDKMTGRPRGFAFVTMDSSEGAQSAIGALNGSDVGGRALVVNEARPKEDRPPRSGGGGGYGGGGGGGYGGGGGERRGGGGERRGGGGGYGGERRGGGRDRY